MSKQAVVVVVALCVLCVLVGVVMPTLDVASALGEGVDVVARVIYKMGDIQ